MSANYAEHAAYHAAVLERQANYRDLGRRYEHFGTWVAVFEDLRARSATRDIGTTWQALCRTDIRLLLRADPDFPPLLREIPWPPHAIYVRGTLPPPDHPGLAIVGTRKATAEGKELARAFARALAEQGLDIVSGLALGIDGAAHEGALEASARTLAVLATGPDTIYPRYHERLGERILTEGGAILSEYPPGSPAVPYRFLERNRLVSGLTLGTLVIEAPARSGSLATARFALEQNRAVFVTPGPIHHPNFAGSHALIRAGAELVTEPAHILEALGLQAPAVRMTDGETPEEMAVLRVLRATPKALDIDNIVELAHLEARVANQTLSFLVIQGLIEERDGGYAAR